MKDQWHTDEAYNILANCHEGLYRAARREALRSAARLRNWCSDMQVLRGTGVHVTKVDWKEVAECLRAE